MRREDDGFLKYERKEGEYRPVEERVKDFREVSTPLSEDDIILQSRRCMDCGIPFCHALGCPLGNLIPEFNTLLSMGEWEKAYMRLKITNPFPEFTGRLCPALCEASCTLSIDGEAVSIREIELFLAEKAFKEGFEKPLSPDENGLSAAVVGSGPAGLAAAYRLREKGFKVRVYEKNDKPGGILRYGIPDFKIEKSVVERRIKLLEESGIEFITSTDPALNPGVESLLKNNSSLILAIGAGVPRDMDIPGRELKGIHFAMDYLTGLNRKVSGMKAVSAKITAEGKNVLIIGGGDTGSDCAGSARREGAEKIYQFEIMTKPPENEGKSNPVWPAWPLILRTSSSHREGVEREWSILTERFIGREGRVSATEFSKIEWFKDEEGIQCFRKIPGGSFSLDVDLVLIAAGFLHPEQDGFASQLKLEFNSRGNIKTEEFRTGIPGVYAAGDASRGASLIVNAIDEGQGAALAASGYTAGRNSIV